MQAKVSLMPHILIIRSRDMVIQIIQYYFAADVPTRSVKKTVVVLLCQTFSFCVVGIISIDTGKIVTTQLPRKIDPKGLSRKTRRRIYQKFMFET